jgi:hypothetical protein
MRVYSSASSVSPPSAPAVGVRRPSVGPSAVGVVGVRGSTVAFVWLRVETEEASERERPGVCPSINGSLGARVRLV